MANQLPPPITRVVKDDGTVKVHTFIAPEAFLANATHIIESPNALVIVDGQFIVPYAMQFRAYADALGKPIDRLYLTHGHPDHFFGVGAAFADVPVHALSETIAFLQASGESIRAARAQEYGPFVADKVVIPTHEAVPGRTVIDGVTYELIKDVDSETDFHLSLKLPELGVYIAQDLIYSGAHLYLTQFLDHWIQILNGVSDSPGYELFLAGHGPPADRAEVLANVAYLETAKKVLEGKPTPEDFKAQLLAAYPQRTGAGIIDIYVPRLFA